MAFTPSQRKHARAMSRDRSKYVNPGIPVALRTTLRLMQRVLNGYGRGERRFRHIIDRYLEDFARSLNDGMATGYLMGARRAVIHSGLKLQQQGEYDEALRFLQRRLNLDTADMDEVDAFYRAPALRVVDTVANSVDQALQRTIVRITQEGLHVREGKARLAQAFEKLGLTPKHRGTLEAVYRTQTQLSYSAGQWAYNQQPEIQEILWGYRYSAVGDERTREEHAMLDGTTLPKDDPRWASIFPPNGWNSLLPGTQIAGDVLSASKAEYAGPIVEIETGQGSRLALTINHPVLTQRGFVAAHELRKGDDLFQYLPEIDRFTKAVRENGVALPKMFGRAVDDEDAPPGIQDVFDAFLATTARSQLARSTPLDFHGDAVFHQGDVHVVGADGMLPGDCDALRAKLAAQISLVPSPDTSEFAGHGPTLGTAGAAGLCRLGASPQTDPLALEPIIDDVTRAAMTLRQLQDRHASSVRLDKIIRLNVRSWSGHVYDLQTANGIIVANGLIVSNCRCVAIEIYRTVEAQAPPPPKEVNGKIIVPGPDKGFDFNPGEALDAIGQQQAIKRAMAIA